MEGTELIRVPFGKDPVNLGDYDELVAGGQTSFGIKNRVNRYDCEWESLIENNTYPPATLNTSTGVITPDTTHWSKINGSYNTWLIDHGYKKVDAGNVKDNTLNKPQNEINASVVGEIGSDSTSGTIKGRIKTLENSVGSGGSVDQRIATAKNEIIGGATSNGNTLKKVEDRVSPLESAVGTGGSVDERIATEGAKHYLKSETYTKDEVNGMITTPDQEFVSVEATNQTTAATDILPATGQADTIYRVGNWNGNQYDTTCYTEYTWNTQNNNYIKLSTKNVGIDDTPTPDSNNLVKSGGVFPLKQEIYGDVNANFAVGGLNSGTGAETTSESRFRTGFIDLRNNSVSLDCTNGIVVYFACVYSSANVSGYQKSVDYTNAANIVLDKKYYGDYVRVCFKKTDGTDFVIGDSSYITLKYKSLVEKTDETSAYSSQRISPCIEIGGINGITGAPVVTNARMRTDFIDLINGDVHVKTPNNMSIYLALLYSDKGTAPIDNISIGEKEYTFKKSEFSNYVRIIFKKDDDSDFDTTNVDDVLLEECGYDKMIEKHDVTIKEHSASILSLDNAVFRSDFGFDVEQGAINSSTGVKTTSSARVRIFVNGKFYIQLKKGYLIYFVGKYTKAGVYQTSIVDGFTEDRVTIDNNNYNYCIVIKKADNGEFSPSDDIVETLEYGLAFDCGKKNYSAVRGELENEIEAKLVANSIGTPSSDIQPVDNMAYRYDRLNLMFLTDNHIDLNYLWATEQNMKDAIKFANNAPFKISAILEGGDMVTRIYNGNRNAFIDNLSTAFSFLDGSNMPLLFTKGNHDLNNMSVPVTDMISDDEWGTLYFDGAETNYGIVRKTKSNGKKSGYYYYDIDDFKVRVVSLDCFDHDFTLVDGDGDAVFWGAKDYYVAQEQFDWLVNTAMNFDDKGVGNRDWGVIVILHYFVPNDTSLYFEPIFPKLNEAFRCFNNQEDYAEQYICDVSSHYNLNISAQWSRYANVDDKPYFISVIAGHAHTDKNYIKDGINTIITANNGCGTKPADARIMRVPGTKTQNLFDIFNIDLVTKKIRVFRYGAGVTCFNEGGDRFLPDGLNF